MPMPMKATADGSGVDSGEAVFTIQGNESWAKRRDVTARVTAKLKTDNAGTVLVDEDGKPKLEAKFAW